MAHKQKENIGRRQFDISPSEKLIYYFSCKYKSKLSVGGSLWIFNAHFCFYSNLFGTETKIRLRISEIAKVVPSGNSTLELYTHSQGTHKFVGLPTPDKRDAVVEFIRKKLHDNSVSKSPPSPYDAKSKSKSNHLNNHELPNRGTTMSVRSNSAQSLSALSGSMMRGHSQSMDFGATQITQSSGSPNPNSISNRNRKRTMHPHSRSPPIQKMLDYDADITSDDINTADAISLGDSLKGSKGQNGVNGHNEEHKLSENAVSASNGTTKNINNVNNSESQPMTQHNHPSPAISINGPPQMPPPSIPNSAKAKVSKHRKSSSTGIRRRLPPLRRIESQKSLTVLVTPHVYSDDDIDGGSGSSTSSSALSRSSSRRGNTKDELDALALHKSLSESRKSDRRERSLSENEMAESDSESTSDWLKNKKNGLLKMFKDKFSCLECVVKPKSTKQNKKSDDKHSKSTSALRQLDPDADSIQRSTSCASSDSAPEFLSSPTDTNASNDSNGSNGDINPFPLHIVPPEVSQFIDESFSETPIHLGSANDIEWAPLFSDEFWAKPPNVFHESFSEKFLKDIHQQRESKDITVTEWVVDDDEQTPSNQPTAYTRKLEFVSKIKDPPPFMPSHTECYQTERFRFYGSDMVVIDSSISTPNIKYGDYFFILNRIILTVSDENPDKTRMEVSIAFKWLKKTWFEKIITSKATSEAQEGMALFAANVHKLFPPKLSDQRSTSSPQKQQEASPNVNRNRNIMSSPSPRRRVIDQKVLDYFHTERKRKDVIIEDWIKPIGEIFVDVVSALFRWSSWTNLVEKLRKIDEEQNDLFTIKHGLMGLMIFVVVLMIGNVCWMMMWWWQSAALNAILRQQNDIIEQRTEMLMELIKLLNDQHAINQGGEFNEN